MAVKVVIVYKNVSFLQVVVSRLLESCMHYVMLKQSPLAHWHPVLGWFAQSTDAFTQASMPLVKQQLHLLWSGPLVKLLLGNVLAEFAEKIQTEEEVKSPAPTNILRRYALQIFFVLIYL